MSDRERALRLRAFQRRRRERLLAVLPRIYDRQPESSVVHQLLDLMAYRLAEIDDALEQLMAGLWVRTASGSPLFEDTPAPLDLLGALFNLPRMSADATPATPATSATKETGKPEETQDYRERLLIMAPLLAQGVTTPSILLELTRAILGDDSEPVIIDNPLQSRVQSAARLSHESRFSVKNDGMLADRPVLQLTAVDSDVHYPAVRNRSWGEVVLYAGKIPSGQTLVIRSDLETERRQLFEGVGRPSLPPIALLDGKDVSSAIYYLAGAARFASSDAKPDDPGVTRFAPPNTPLDAPAVARFASPGRMLRTPLVEVGETEWIFLLYTKEELRGMIDGDIPDLPSDKSGRVDLELSFFTRAAAAFLLVVKSTITTRDPRRVQLLRKIVERTRAAGVRAVIEFLEPPRQEDHHEFLKEEAHRSVGLRPHEEAGLADPRLRITGTVSLAERHELGEHEAIFGGVLDVTRFELSRFR